MKLHPATRGHLCSRDLPCFLGALAALVAFVLCGQAHCLAQCEEGWLPGRKFPGFSGALNVMVPLPNGDIIVGGSFSAPDGGTPANNIARFSPSTGQWSALGFGVTGGTSTFLVNAIAPTPDGSLIVGGSFTIANGVPRNAVAAYSLDSGEWSSLGSGILTTGTNGVTALGVLPDGDVVAGGDFASAPNHAFQNIAIFSRQTQTWTQVGAGLNGLVRAITVLPDGTIIAGGNFTASGTQPINYIAKCSPGTNSWQPIGAGVGSGVTCLTQLSDGTVAVGGSFFTAGGVSCNCAAKVDVQTGTWTNFSTPVFGVPGLPGPVTSFTELPDGDVIAGGYFIYPGQAPSGRDGNIMRWSHLTQSWSAIGRGCDDAVSSLVTTPSGTVFVGGSFTHAGGITAVRFVQFDPATEFWQRFGDGANRSMDAIHKLPGGDVVAAGNFSFVDGIEVPGVARYSPDTDSWSQIGTGLFPLNMTRAYEIDNTSNGDIYVCGPAFTPPGNINASTLMAVYAASTGLWSAAFNTTNAIGYAYALRVLPDDDVVIAGNFQFASQGTLFTGIARYSPSTGQWSSLGGGIPRFTNAYALLPLPNGELVVGGDFSSVGGATSRGIAIYNFQTNTWRSAGTGIASNSPTFVSGLALLADGNVLASGSFRSAGGIRARDIAVYSPSTNSWGAVGGRVTDTGDTQINHVEVLPNGDLLVNIVSQSTPSSSGIMQYVAATGEWLPLLGTPAGLVRNFVRLDDQSLFVSGGFTGIAGAPSSYVGRYAFGSPRIASPYYLIEVCPGFNQSFNAGALGLQPMQFHWRFGGVLIDPTENPSAVTPHLTLSNIQASDAGVYDCIVTNECGPITSGPSQITLLPAYLQFCGGPGCDADVNQDGVTDQGDVDALINIIAGGGNPGGIDPDFNHDGVGDQGDIDALINVIAGGVCP